MQYKCEMQNSGKPMVYEYAVIRYVPRVEREEFVNVGLVMMCKSKRWIKAVVNVNEEKIRALFPGSDLDVLGRQLESFLLISEGRSASPIAKLEAHERFRWLTAVRSASITTSRPHPGIAADLEREFDTLVAELVE